MYRVLPENPSLEALQKQARDLQRSAAAGDDSCRDTLRQLDQFRRLPGDMLPTEVKLTQAQFALALDYGFRSWQELRDFVTWNPPRTVVTEGQIQRISYRPERIAEHLAEQPLFTHTDLTWRQHTIHQFHNESMCLQPLDGLRASRLVDVDDQSMCIVVESAGDVIDTADVAAADESLVALAQMHRHMMANTPALRPVWHTEVTETWYFSTYSPRRLEDLRQTNFADVLDAQDWLVRIGETAKVGFCHRQIGGNRVRRHDGEIEFHGFDCAHLRQTMADVEDLLRPIAVRQRVDLKWWISAWERYAQAHGELTQADLHVFLYLILRRICRRLAKSDVSSEGFQLWLIQTAVDALGELRNFRSERS
ncbi:MAG: hypothetical protein HOC05_16780 [Gemmatimonadetes bacterium]|nr:hypothetical protein [Gemmatimonadota bacterium]